MENEMVNRTAEYSAKATKAKEPRVNWEKSYIIVEQSDSFLEALEYAELDFIQTPVPLKLSVQFLVSVN